MYYNEIPGYFEIGDFKILCKLSQRIPLNGSIVEVGSHFGKSTVGWLDNVDPSVTVYCIDHWGEWNKAPNVNRLDEFRKNTLGYSNLVEYIGTSPPNNSMFDTKFDLVFLDGDHSYDALKADIEYWSKRIKKNGVLCGHDYKITIFPEVLKVVDEFIASHNYVYELRPYNSSFWVIYF